MKAIVIIKNDRASNTIFTLVYYAFACLVVFYIFRSGNFKSGPCNIGLDLVSFLLAGLITFCLLIRNIVLAIWKKKLRWIPLVMHVMALGIWIFILQRNS
jgi:hypothetical protein